MNAAEEIKQKQLEKINNLLFEIFKEESQLGCEYSLADHDYYDSNRWYPNHGLDWCKKIPNLKIGTLFPDHWPEEEKKFLEHQITNKSIIYKTVHWSAVSAQYMRRHQGGFFHMSPHSFKYYLAAWIFQYCKLYSTGNIRLIADASFYFLSVFSSKFVGSKNKWWLSLSDEQIHIIIDFLIFLIMSDYDNKDLARKCLQCGWLEYDGYGTEVLERYEEEKLIQDFIDRD